MENIEIYENYIRSAYVDPALIFILTNMDNSFYYDFKVYIKIHKNPEKVPDNIYKIIRIANTFKTFEIEEILFTDTAEEQYVEFRNGNKKIFLKYSQILGDINEVVHHLIKYSGDNLSSMMMHIFMKSARLAHILKNASIIIEESSKPDTSVDKLIYGILTGITAGFGAAFNRAVIFRKYGDIYKVMRALGPSNNANANEVWHSIKGLTIDLYESLDRYTESEFFCEFEERIKDTVIKKSEILDNPLLKESFDKNIAQKVPLSYVKGDFVKKIDMVAEFAIMPMKFDNKIYGFILCDNRYNFKPISDEQIEMLDYFGKQAVILWENKVSVEALKFEAEIDTLTKFGNRNSYEKYLEKLSVSKIKSLGIIMIDLDEFKNINDSSGHAKGDEILVKFSKAVRIVLRKSDIIFRYGGDEFVIFVNDADEKVLYEIINNIQKNYKELTGYTFSSGAVINDYEDIYLSIEKADRLLYKSKNSGKGKLSFM
ncbi:MAG: GGDEF domain-containing protein [Thermotogae bacterium]|nr:GGDEF domain-containing protein [Thermotogota bacterium]